MRQGLFWQIPLLLFLMFLPFASFLDLRIASYFVGNDLRFAAPKWCSTVYAYGPLFGQALFVASILLLGYGLCTKRFSLCFYAWYISLTLLIGTGFIGHLVCKQFWTRPRPTQTALFGGKYPYCHPLCRYKGPVDKRLKSMPSGHASWGFYFITLFFLGKRLNNRILSRAGLLRWHCLSKSRG